MFLFFIIALVTVSSCTKPECKTSADCSSRACYLSKCEDKKCVYTLQRNCCGNRINESIENGKPGNQCTCPQDYGKCEGKGKIRFGSRVEDATYVHYYCNADEQCVLGVEGKDVAPQNYLDTINPGYFKASSVVSYNKPFDISKNSFEFTITLDDAHKDLVLPITLTKVKLLFSSQYTKIEQLIAEKDLGDALDDIGAQARISVPLNLNYKPEELEELGGVRYMVDYVYEKRVLSKAVYEENAYDTETVRATFTSPAKPVFFVRSE